MNSQYTDGPFRPIGTSDRPTKSSTGQVNPSGSECDCNERQPREYLLFSSEQHIAQDLEVRSMDLDPVLTGKENVPEC